MVSGMSHLKQGYMLFLILMILSLHQENEGALTTMGARDVLLFIGAMLLIK